MILQFQSQVHQRLQRELFHTHPHCFHDAKVSLSSVNTLARTDDLSATTEFQKNTIDLGAKSSVKGENHIPKPKGKSLLFLEFNSKDSIQLFQIFHLCLPTYALRIFFLKHLTIAYLFPGSS